MFCKLQPCKIDQTDMHAGPDITRNTTSTEKDKRTTCRDPIDILAKRSCTMESEVLTLPYIVRLR